MVMKLGLSHVERGSQVKDFENKVPYLGSYLRLREMKLQEDGESNLMLSYMHVSFT